MIFHLGLLDKSPNTALPFKEMGPDPIATVKAKPNPDEVRAPTHKPAGNKIQGPTFRTCEQLPASRQLYTWESSLLFPEFHQQGCIC